MKTKTVELNDEKFVLAELTQGDLIEIDNGSKRFNPRGAPYNDDRLSELGYIVHSLKEWTDANGVKKEINDDSVKSISLAVFKVLLEEASKLNMTDKELENFLALFGPPEKKKKTNLSTPKP